MSGATGASGSRGGSRGSEGRRRPPYPVVLFDLDGTLADTVGLILHCYRHTMEVHLGRALPDERWLATIGRPLRDQMLDFCEGPDEAEAMIRTYVAHQREVHDGMVRPFPGACDLLDELAGRGVRLGVVTSKRREMAERTLDRCGLRGAVEVLVGADDVRHGKPDPEPVVRALDALGDAAPGDAVFVGDSPYDLRAGRAAGVATAGVLWGPFDEEALRRDSPDHLVGSVEELRDVLLDGSAGGGSHDTRGDQAGSGGGESGPGGHPSPSRG